MTKPGMPNMAGMEAMTDAFDFMKKMWGGMSGPPAGLPGMVMPTLSVEEINKQIADLKAVESWLNVNMNMLRGTIQALEVQSATISSLQAMSQSFGAAMTPEPSQAKRSDKSGAAERNNNEGSKEARPYPESRPKKEPSSRSVRNSRASAKEAPASQASEPRQSPLADPAAWWNMLQNQFNQAVGSAIAEPAAQPAPVAPRKRKAPVRRPG